MAATSTVEVRVQARLVVDDSTRAVLEALGWTPPTDEAQGCSCDQADDCDLRAYPSHENPHRTVPGRLDPACPEHGNRP